MAEAGTCECGSTVRTRSGDCAACEEEAIASRLLMHAGHLREIETAFAKRKGEAEQYLPALLAGMDALQEQRTNHLWLSRVLRPKSGARRAAH